MSSTKKEYFRVFVFLVALGAVFSLFSFVGYFYHTKEVYEFGVVVDISSYDIEFNLYKWKNTERIKQTAKVNKMFTINCQINVHDDALTLDDLKERMFQCVKQVTEPIQDFELYNSTLFIYGTELTRWLCYLSDEKCSKIFSTIAEVLEAFEMRISLSNFRPLTGFEEAAFGWIGINDYFNNIERSSNKLYGGIDLKNYSVLISFDKDKTSLPTLKYNTSRYDLYGNSYYIAGYDLMCYGLTQFYNRVLFDLIMANINSNTIKHPCHRLDYNIKFETFKLFSPCLVRPFAKLKDVYTIVGSQNVEQCTQIIKDSLKEYDLVQNNTLDSIKQDLTTTTGDFIGFSRLSEIANILSFDGRTLTDLYQLGLQQCTSNTKDDYKTGCFDIIYSNHLIGDKLGINSSKVIIGYKEKIETVTGAMVYHSKFIPPRKCQRFLSEVGFTSVLFSALVYISCGCYMLYKWNLLREKY